MTDTPKIPANLIQFVDVLGPELTVKFLLGFGGASLYLPNEYPRAGSMLFELVGREKAIELGQKIGSGYIKVPVAKRFIAQYYFAQGDSLSAICRKLHLTEPTIRGYISANDREERQLSLKL